MKLEIQTMPIVSDLQTLPIGLYDTAERRTDDEYDITQNLRFHDCISRKLVRIDDGSELPASLEAWFRDDGKRVLVGWDIIERGEEFGERARRQS